MHRCVLDIDASELSHVRRAIRITATTDAPVLPHHPPPTHPPLERACMGACKAALLASLYCLPSNAAVPILEREREYRVQSIGIE